MSSALRAAWEAYAACDVARRQAGGDRERLDREMRRARVALHDCLCAEGWEPDPLVAQQVAEDRAVLDAT